MKHPYASAPPRSFWKKSIHSSWDPSAAYTGETLIHKGEKVASAGSCFAANIVPFLEKAGFEYVRKPEYGRAFGDLALDHAGYSRFSAAYGNIYTARQAVQLVERVLGGFRPVEDRWAIADDLIVDPFRPGLKYPASSHREFDLLTAQYLQNVRDAIAAADVFVFTLGLTEAWLSTADGAVFPACPGVIAGTFDEKRHRFHNFTFGEVSTDLDMLIRRLREINPALRLILTVSPVPLVATATEEHVLVATSLSKAVLRAAAGEAALRHKGVAYFPAYEIVTGPQAPENFFEADRREPSAVAIQYVMHALLAHCETRHRVSIDTIAAAAAAATGSPRAKVSGSPGKGTAAEDHAQALSRIFAEVDCEEAAAGLTT